MPSFSFESSYAFHHNCFSLRTSRLCSYPLSFLRNTLEQCRRFIQASTHDASVEATRLTKRSTPGIEPGTSSTLRKNHAPRPSRLARLRHLIIYLNRFDSVSDVRGVNEIIDSTQRGHTKPFLPTKLPFFGVPLVVRFHQSKNFRLVNQVTEQS